MTKTTHRLTLLARADLDNIRRFIALEGGNEDIADSQIDMLADRFDLLADGR